MRFPILYFYMVKYFRYNWRKRGTPLLRYLQSTEITLSTTHVAPGMFLKHQLEIDWVRQSNTIELTKTSSQSNTIERFVIQPLFNRTRSKAP
jgi:hypothetical protein